MSSLILDKSVVVAAGRGVLGGLRSQQFSFILTDTLLYEIATERLADRGHLREQDTRRVDGRIAASLGKAREAGDAWIEISQALRWEVVQGESARAAPRFCMKESFSLGNILDALNDVGTACLGHDAALGRIASIRHATGDNAAFKELRGMDVCSFFAYLERQLSSPLLLEDLPMEARSGLVEVAAKHGMEVSPSFVPDRECLAYGIELANRAYLPWKFWRVGDDKADPLKPANPFFDNLYIASMALGDGIISCDRDLLRLSWICWPEKRDDIFRYDTNTHTPNRFQPDWL